MFCSRAFLLNITMPLRKKKISELPLVESLKGLYTIGYKIIDGIKTSVKVSLEDIQIAYQDVVNAIKKSEEAAKNANNAATTANEKAVLADTAAANANDTAEHPTYIGQDHYVYKWNKTAQAYDKTDIYTKGDAFSIKKVYASVANMEADKSNPDITEGDFVLVNTGDVEDPDNAKLYVKADGDFEFLVDMSGAIGFTGKTPQFSMGTVTTLEAGASATATVSSDGTDEGGNPKYKLNFAIPRGNPGAPFRIAGEYATLEALKSAVPDGSAVDGFMAVGTEAPYDYYAWVNGDWVNQGKIAGGGSGNVVVIPAAAMSLSDQATSDEIFNAFGGKDAFMDICQSIVNKDTVCVVANIPEESGMKLVYIPIMAMATYTDANNANFMMAIITETTFQLVVTVTDGVATQSSQVLNHIYEAPSNGNVYGRKNKDWVKVPEKSDVDDSISSARNAGYMMQLTEIDASGLDENTWYPVVMSLGNRNTVRIEVLVGLDSATIPSWSTHYNGFSVRKIWEVNGDGWGTSHVNRQIFVSDYKFADIDPVRGVGQLTNFSNEYVFVRGGGKYHFYTSHNTIPVLKTEIFVDGGGASISPTTETPDEIVVNPATKKYVDDSIKESLYYVNNDKFLSYFITPAYRIDSDAEDSIIMCFNTIDNFKAFVDKAIDAGVTLVFINNNLNEKIYIRDYHVYRSNNNNRELSFIFNYSNNGESFQFITTRVFISYNASYGYKFVVKNLISSDNLTTITKKTAAEYEAIGSKDANTAYCVTD